MGARNWVLKNHDTDWSSSLAIVTKPVPDDTRGIIDPLEMLRYADFARFPAEDALDGLIEWFWAVAW